MGRLLGVLFAVLVIMLAPSPAGAACTPGTQYSCSCPNGARGSQVCEWTGLTLSVCACGAFSVPELPEIPSRRPRRARRRGGCAGLGLLIPGGIELALGTGSLIFGIDQLNREKMKPDPKPALGALAIAGGSIQMAIGLPLTIFGIVCLCSSRRKHGGYVHPTATGLSFQF